MTSISASKEQTYIALYQGKYAAAFIQTGAGFEVLHKCIVIGYCKAVSLPEAWKDLEKDLVNFSFRKRLIPEVLENTMLYRLDTPEIYYSKEES